VTIETCSCSLVDFVLSDLVRISTHQSQLTRLFFDKQMKFGFSLLAVFALAVFHTTHAEECTIFELWNADTNTPTGIYLPPGGGEICQEAFEFNIEADISSCITPGGYDQDIHVQLTLEGPVGNSKWEGRAPYTVFGDKDKDPSNIRVNGRPMLLGEYIMSSKSVGKDSTGAKQVLEDWETTFTVVDCEGNPDPECAAASCTNFIPCNAGGSCASSGVCGALSDDGVTNNAGGLCVDGSTSCAALIECPNGVSDCPTDGSLCFIDSCCGSPVCVPPAAFCTNSDRLFMRGLAASKSRNLDEEGPHFGYNE